MFLVVVDDALHIGAIQTILRFEQLNFTKLKITLRDLAITFVGLYVIQQEHPRKILLGQDDHIKEFVHKFS